MAENPEIAAARQRMIAKRFGGQAQVRTGGKGSVRRKKKAVYKTTGSDDKKLTTALKKLGVTNIPAIEEVNLFTKDGNVIHFQNPKVQANITANTYVVSGPNETKSISEMLPNIMTQMGPETLEHMKQQYASMSAAAGAGAAAADDDDDEVPDLVENFEAVSED